MQITATSVGAMAHEEESVEKRGREEVEEGEREMLSPPAPRSFLSLTSYHLKCALLLLMGFLEKMSSSIFAF